MLHEFLKNNWDEFIALLAESLAPASNSATVFEGNNRVQGNTGNGTVAPGYVLVRYDSPEYHALVRTAKVKDLLKFEDLKSLGGRLKHADQNSGEKLPEDPEVPGFVDLGVVLSSRQRYAAYDYHQTAISMLNDGSRWAVVRKPNGKLAVRYVWRR